MADLAERFEQGLRASHRRLTKQRLLLAEVLEDAGGHLDANTLHERARLRDASISLGTVYRTLSLLREMGLVDEHRLVKARSHFEVASDGPHYHMRCLGCGKVLEFDTQLVDRIAEELFEREGFIVAQASLYLSGYCSACQ